MSTMDFQIGHLEGEEKERCYSEDEPFDDIKCLQEEEEPFDESTEMESSKCG